MIKFTALAAILSITVAASAAVNAPANPYAGQEAQAAKSLSDAEVAGLLSGKGAGLAKAAELDGDPGPAHVLELAAPLKLDANQLEATRQLMAVHLSSATQHGAELLASERTLDALSAQRQADPASMVRATQHVGGQRARLRAEHLTVQLAQTALLSAEQVRRHRAPRGCADADPGVGTCQRQHITKPFW